MVLIREPDLSQEKMEIWGRQAQGKSKRVENGNHYAKKFPEGTITKGGDLGRNSDLCPSLQNLNTQQTELHGRQSICCWYLEVKMKH